VIQCDNEETSAHCLFLVILADDDDIECTVQIESIPSASSSSTSSSTTPTSLPLPNAFLPSGSTDDPTKLSEAKKQLFTSSCPTEPRMLLAKDVLQIVETRAEKGATLSELCVRFAYLSPPSASLTHRSSHIPTGSPPQFSSPFNPLLPLYPHSLLSPSPTPNYFPYLVLPNLRFPSPLVSPLDSLSFPCSSWSIPLPSLVDWIRWSGQSRIIY